MFMKVSQTLFCRCRLVNNKSSYAVSCIFSSLVLYESQIHFTPMFWQLLYLSKWEWVIVSLTLLSFCIMYLMSFPFVVSSYFFADIPLCSGTSWMLSSFAYLFLFLLRGWESYTCPPRHPLKSLTSRVTNITFDGSLLHIVWLSEK